MPCPSSPVRNALSQIALESRGTTVHLLKQRSKPTAERVVRKTYTLLQPEAKLVRPPPQVFQAPVVSIFEPSQFQDVQASINSKKKRQRSKDREPQGSCPV